MRRKRGVVRVQKTMSEPLSEERMLHPEWMSKGFFYEVDVLSALEGLKEELQKRSMILLEKANYESAKSSQLYGIGYADGYSHSEELIDKWFPIALQSHLEKSEDKSVRLGETLSRSIALDKSGVEAMSRGSSDLRSNSLLDRKAVGGSEIDEQMFYNKNVNWMAIRILDEHRKYAHKKTKDFSETFWAKCAAGKIIGTMFSLSQPSLVQTAEEGVNSPQRGVQAGELSVGVESLVRDKKADVKHTPGNGFTLRQCVECKTMKNMRGNKIKCTRCERSRNGGYQNKEVKK